MLIYNHKKEFLGIDETDLTSLGFSSLSELQAEADDFAELFVKEPGHIHNFKHIHWIDFAECSDSIESSKVIIKTSSKSFKCSIDVKSAYLIDNPNEKAFLVYLQNLRELSVDENGEVTETLVATSAPKIVEEIPKPVTAAEPVYEQHGIEEENNEAASEEETILQAEIEEPVEKTQEIKEEIYEEPSIDLNPDEPLNIKLDEQSSEVEETDDEKFEQEQDSYTYDPHVASAELGLPVDLIEEFIQDFIDQAKDFKEDLYSSFNNGDTSTVKSLSHKLKGVAANLRIEDALEALTTINTSDNQTEVKSNLDHFYIIISKLAGEKVTVAKKAKKTVNKPAAKEEPAIEPETNEDDDSLTINFKDDAESEPEKIEQHKELEAESEDDLLLSFKDDDDTHINIEIPQDLDEKDEDDDMVIDFKDEDDTKETEPPKDIKVESEDDEDDFTIDFKYENDEDTTEDENTTETKESEDIKEVSINYDKETAAKEIGLDNESFKELFDDYIAEAKTLSSKIEDAVKNEDDAAWKSNAIQLKGMSDNMRINDFANELDTLINTNDIEIAKDAAEKINILISKISNIES